MVLHEFLQIWSGFFLFNFFYSQSQDEGMWLVLIQENYFPFLFIS